jgi:F-type H+-transporting ATPase subunit d
MSVKSATSRIDWTALAANLKPETFAAVSAFRAQHQQLSKTLTELKELPTTINFNNYSGLKNSKVVQEAKKSYESFKPSSMDLAAHLKLINQSQAKAVHTIII